MKIQYIAILVVLLCVLLSDVSAETTPHVKRPDPTKRSIQKHYLDRFDLRKSIRHRRKESEANSGILWQGRPKAAHLPRK